MSINKFKKSTDGRLSCMGSGQYNYGIIKIREYPDGFVLGTKNKFVERLHSQEVGGTFNGHDVSDKYIGMNGCGRCMMAVRDKFRGWSDTQLKANTPSCNLEEWWKSSPTYVKQLDGMGV